MKRIISFNGHNPNIMKSFTSTFLGIFLLNGFIDSSDVSATKPEEKYTINSETFDYYLASENSHLESLATALQEMHSVQNPARESSRPRCPVDPNRVSSLLDGTHMETLATVVTMGLYTAKAAIDAQEQSGQDARGTINYGDMIDSLQALRKAVLGQRTLMYDFTEKYNRLPSLDYPTNQLNTNLRYLASEIDGIQRATNTDTGEVFYRYNDIPRQTIKADLKTTLDKLRADLAAYEDFEAGTIETPMLWSQAAQWFTDMDIPTLVSNLIRWTLCWEGTDNFIQEPSQEEESKDPYDGKPTRSRLQTLFGNVGSALKSTSGSISDTLRTTTGGLASSLAGPTSAFREKASDIGGRIKGTALNVGEKLKDKASNASGRLIDKAGDIGSKIKDTASNISGSVADVATGLLKKEDDLDKQLAGLELQGFSGPYPDTEL
ncbi:hypothetical protein ABW19_dt0202769 [Dactylella cylindrospora]|nr:hypothetical protein ABW19_dt0202769 [Dactylella cylindrospora]